MKDTFESIVLTVERLGNINFSSTKHVDCSLGARIVSECLG